MVVIQCFWHILNNYKLINKNNIYLLLKRHELDKLRFGGATS